MNLMAFSFTYQTIGWILAGVVLLFLLIGMFWGLIRGLQKTAFRCGWQVFFLIVFALLTPVIVGGLLKINIGFLNININGQKMTSIDGLILNSILSIDNSLTNSIASNPVLIEFVSKLPYLILNVFVFVLLFWISNLLFWPFWAIASHFIFKKQKLAKKAGEPVKKFRLLGGLMGIVFGLIFSAFTFMPVVGILNSANSLNKARATFITGEQTEEGIIDYYLKDNADYVLKMDDTPAFLIYRYTGLEFIDNVTFDGLSRAKVNGQQLKLKKELDTTVNVLNAIGDIRVIDFNNLTQTSANKLIASCRVLVSYLTQLQTFRILGNDLLPTLADYIIDENLLPSLGSVGADNLADSIIEEVGRTNANELKNELDAVLNVLQLFNDKDILVPLINKQMNTKELLNKIDDTFVSTFVDDLYASRIFNSTAPKIINFSVELMLNALDGEGFEEKTDIDESAKETFKSMLTSAVEVAQKMQQDTVPDTIVDSAANVLKGVKKLTTEKTYHALIDAIANKAVSKLDQAIRTHIENALTNLKHLKEEEIDAEFELYKSVFEQVWELKDSNFSDVSSLELDKVGHVLDTLSDSKVFGNEIDPLITSLIDKAEPEITNGLTDEGLKTAITDAFDVLKQNLKTITRPQKDPSKPGFYETELGALKPLLSLKIDENDLSSAGKTLDDIKDNSTLLTTPAQGMQEKGSALNILLNAMFDTVTKTITDDGLQGILTKIKANLNKVDSYEHEFNYIKDIKDNITIDTSQKVGTPEFTEVLVNYGKLLDKLVDSQLLVNGDQDIRRDIFIYGIDKLKASQTNEDLNKIFDNAKENAKDIETNKEAPVYETIFTDLNTALTKTNELQDSSKLQPGDGLDQTLKDLGKMLDDLRTDQLFVNTTQGHEHDLRQDILTLAIDKASSSIVKDNDTISEMLTEIKNNITKLPIDHTTLIYEHELTSLAELINTLNKISYDKIDNGLSELATLTNTLKSGSGDKAKSILCEDSGYYILKIFSSVIADLQTLKDNVKDPDGNIKKYMDANIENLRTNYGKTEGYDYGTAINGLVNINKEIATDLSGKIDELNKDVTSINVAEFGKLFDTLQETILLDYNVTQVISTSILGKIKDLIKTKITQLKNAASIVPDIEQKATAAEKAIVEQIEREILTINAQTGDYVKDSDIPNIIQGENSELESDLVYGSPLWPHTNNAGGYGYEQEGKYYGSLGRIRDKITEQLATLAVGPQA